VEAGRRGGGGGEDEEEFESCVTNSVGKDGDGKGGMVAKTDGGRIIYRGSDHSLLVYKRGGSLCS